MLLAAAAVPWVVDCRLDCVDDGGGDRDLFPLAEHRGSITVRPLTLNGKPWNTGTDPEDTQDEVTEAQDFQMFYHRTFKVVLNKRMNEAYVLHQCGATPAPESEVAAALEAAGATDFKMKSFSVPLTAVAVETTVPIAFMEDLKLHPRIKYLTQYTASACSQRLLGCQGELFNKSLTAHTEPLDAIIRSDTFVDPNSESYPHDLDYKIIQFSASQDPGALARAEWHKFIGAFFNKELVAEELYGQIVESFTEFDSRESATGAPLPSVVWCNHRGWNPSMPMECFTGGSFQYKKDLIEAAGGQLLNSTDSDVDSALFTLADDDSIAALHAYLQQADVIVDETYAFDGNAYTMDTFAQNYRIDSLANSTMPFIVNNLVLRVDKAIGEESGGAEWLQTAVSRPDRVAMDLAKYISPDLLDDATMDTYFVRNIAEQELILLVSPSVCPLATCDAIIAEAAQNPICPLDIQLCSDGNGYLKPEFRDNENECQFKADCELPGLKSRQPLECAESDVVGSGDKGAFPLVIGEDGKISIEYGTETPSVPAMTNLTTAEDFAITYFDKFKVVLNVRMREVYVLYQCGLFPPTMEEIGEVLATQMMLPVELRSAIPKFFSVPLQSVAVDATIPAAMMEDLRLHPRITHIASYVASPCSQKLLSCGTQLNHSSPDHVDPLDAIFRSDTPSFPGSYPSSVEGKVIQFSASQDPGALKRAEWIKFVSFFFNKELLAESIYDQVVEEYTALHVAANGVDGPKSKVAWCSYNSWSSSMVCYTNVQYRIDLTEAAGGVIVASPRTSGTSVSFAVMESDAEVAALREYLMEVDVLIDETYAADNNAYTIVDFKQNYRVEEDGDDEKFAFLANQAVYRLDKAIGADTNGLDWFQTAVARPDKVVEDLISFITPEASPAGHVTHFFRNLAKGEGVEMMGADECEIGSMGTSTGGSDDVISCDLFLASIQENPICPLDIKVCGTQIKVRQPAMNCEFEACGVTQDIVIPEVPEDAEEVTVVSASYTLPDITSADFSDIIHAVFRRSVADLAGVNIADVRITEQSSSGSAVVKADVIFTDADDAGQFLDSLMSGLGDNFHSSLGSVTVEEVSLKEWMYNEYLEDSGAHHATASLVATVLLAMSSAIALWW